MFETEAHSTAAYDSVRDDHCIHFPNCLLVTLSCYVALSLLGTSQGYGFTLEVGMSEIEIMKLAGGSRFMLDVLQALNGV